MDNKSGFTLIELMIVISIIALLSVMIWFNQKNQINKGFDGRRKENLRRLKTAFEEYYNDHDCYPVLLDCLNHQDDLKPYIDTVPCDPLGISYHLQTDGSACPQSFQIYTNLQNTNDREIRSLNCTGGCQNNPSYNYGVSSTDTSP